MLGSPGRNQSWLPSPDPEKVKLGPQQRESSAKVLCLALCPASPRPKAWPQLVEEAVAMTIHGAGLPATTFS